MNKDNEQQIKLLEREAKISLRSKQKSVNKTEIHEQQNRKTMENTKCNQKLLPWEMRQSDTPGG